MKILALSNRGRGGLYISEVDSPDFTIKPMGQDGADFYPISYRARMRFPFAVECKLRSEIAKDTLLWALRGGLSEWWKQASANAEALELNPLVVFRQDRGIPFAAFSAESSFTGLKVPKPTPAAFCPTDSGGIVVMTLEDFMVTVGKVS